MKKEFSCSEGIPNSSIGNQTNYQENGSQKRQKRLEQCSVSG